MDTGIADDRGWVLGKINYDNLMNQVTNVVYNPNKPTAAQDHYIKSNDKGVESHKFLF